MRKKACILLVVSCLLIMPLLSGCQTNGEEESYATTYEGYAYSDYIEAGQYKGMTVTDKKIKVSKKDIQEEIQQRLKQQSTVVEKTSGTVKKDDLVNLDYEVKRGKKVFDASLDGSIEYKIGESKEIVEGFDDALVNAQIGKVATLKVKLPDNLEKSAEKSEQPTICEIKINHVKASKTPSYSEAWIKKNTKCKSKKEYEKKIKKELNAKKVKQQLWEDVVDETKIRQMPKEKVKLYAFDDTYQSFWKQETKKQKDTEQARKENVKKTLLLYQIAEQEGLSYTKAEQKQAEKELLGVGYTLRQFDEKIGSDAEAYLKQRLLYDKVLDLLYENVKDSGKTEMKKKSEKVEASTEASREREQPSSTTKPKQETTKQTAPKKESKPKKETNTEPSSDSGGADF